MPSRVTLKVIKGNQKGREFSYDQKEALILGRQNDCNIVISENTVSRYHCMIEVSPPNITVRDFGSLNGTFLNSQKIGQREKEMSIEDARNEVYNEFPLKQGDTLGLGRDCTLAISVYTPSYCGDCLCEISDAENGQFFNDHGQMLCRACHEKLRAQKAEMEAAKKAAQQAKFKREKIERLAADLAAREKAAADRAVREKAERERREAERKAAELKAAEAKRRQEETEAKRRAEERAKAARRAQNAKCEICGASFSPNTLDDKVCQSCLADPMKMLEFLLLQAMGGAPEVQGIKGYRKIKMLGRGGMGEVWLVEEEKTQKQMALKLMLPKVAGDARARALFMREATNAERLRHKNVVRQNSSGTSNGTFFILMELCRGGSVDDLIKKHGGKLPVNLATDIMLQVLDGLDYAHHAKIETKLENGQTKMVHGLVHRDFKPGNIFLSDTSAHPIAKVADFGLAKSFETAGLTGMTRTGSAGGTPVFMPRQQILNFKYAKPDVDVWAAAASYYFMLTGTFPKECKGKDIWMAMLSGKAVPIRKRNSSIPKKLAEVIDEALIDQPKIRISSAAELKKMIRRVI